MTSCKTFSAWNRYCFFLVPKKTINAKRTHFQIYRKMGFNETSGMFRQWCQQNTSTKIIHRVLCCHWELCMFHFKIKKQFTHRKVGSLCNCLVCNVYIRGIGHCGGRNDHNSVVFLLKTQFLTFRDVTYAKLPISLADNAWWLHAHLPNAPTEAPAGHTYY